MDWREESRYRDPREKLAEEVLLLSRNQLLVSLRFLDAALGQLSFVPVEKTAVLTNGKHIFYNPGFVLAAYRSGQELLVRDYLHMVLHCVFRHMYIGPSMIREYWDLACDIAVENIIMELELKAAAVPWEQEQQAVTERIRKECSHVTAEKVYAYLQKNEKDSGEIRKLQAIFFADDHACWYPKEGEAGQEFENQPRNEREEQAWKAISERIQTELETFGKQRGWAPGALCQNLEALNREQYDYTEFLKKFAVLGEVMQINGDEFDYIFYTYGLQRYKNMPLIEPLEYRVEKRIRDFVIAIDTSGSVAGELVQRFIQKTYNILKSSESFFSRVNIHIIQCDTKIQEDKKITSIAEFYSYLNTMKLRGFGGTDFRPVFQHVEKLRKEKQFRNLKGMIYFTDGYGDFPERKPDYETVFVFVEDENYLGEPEVPPWAMTLVLNAEELKEGSRGTYEY